ncbi:MAG: hypothetical protein M5U09_23810 [Gammaproteobacteria bacterium]|nr:hypothetical protein [Gammaproteobacteria bacterium]
MKSKYVPRLLGTVVAAALLIAGAVTPVNAQDKIAIRIGVQAQTSWLLVTARELQLFEAEGLDPEYKKFTYGALSVQAMQAGEIDLATPGLTPFVAGIAQGVDWKMIGLDNNSSTSKGSLPVRIPTSKYWKTLEANVSALPGVRRPITGFSKH